jgi:hypothetical protein
VAHPVDHHLQIQVPLADSSKNQPTLTWTISPKPPPRPTWLQRVQQYPARMLATFLPAAYPSSVSSGYLAYSQWTFLHTTSASATGGMFPVS